MNSRRTLPAGVQTASDGSSVGGGITGSEEGPLVQVRVDIDATIFPTLWYPPKDW